jgi:alpha-tubulin suppressor-like RCC1 family protein
LTVDGLIFTFGSNNYGQLGVGDLVSRGSQTLVKIPFDVSIVMIAAGSHHSVALTMEGDVLTWGAHIVMSTIFACFNISIFLKNSMMFSLLERTISSGIIRF